MGGSYAFYFSKKYEKLKKLWLSLKVPRHRILILAVKIPWMTVENQNRPCIYYSLQIMLVFFLVAT